MTRRLGIALVGLGPGSEPHAKSLSELADRVEVRAAVTRSAERAAAFGARFPHPVSTDLQAALTDPDVDAVFVLTPPNAHLEIAEAAFEAGKHVLVEKPLEASLARGETLIAAARAAKRRLGVVLQHRFRRGGGRLKQVIDSGRLGAIEAASVTVPWWRPQSYYDVEGRGTRARDGGGVLITQGIHAIDLFRHLVGVSKVEAAQVTTTGLHRMETEDYASALVRLRNGAPGQIMATTAFNPGLPERIEVIGRQGSAALVGGTLKVDYLNGADERVESEGGTGAGANIMDFPIDAHLALITDFIDAIENDRDPAVTGEEALATQRLLEEILAKGSLA